MLRAYYQRLIALRRDEPSLAFPDRARMEVQVLAPTRAMGVRRWSAGGEVFTLLHFGADQASVTVRLPEGTWELTLDSADTRWNGPGSSLPHRIESSGGETLLLPPHGVAVYSRRVTSSAPAHLGARHADVL
jgi:maltooligosyltrehalose trehalohydrolase